MSNRLPGLVVASLLLGVALLLPQTAAADDATAQAAFDRANEAFRGGDIFNGMVFP